MPNPIMIVIIVVLAIALAAAIVACLMMSKSAESKGFEKGVAHNRQETEKQLSDGKAAADARVREADKATKSHTLRYISMNSNSDTRNFDYERVSDAYRKDLLENYTFSYIKESVPIGSIEYENNGTEDYIFGSLDIYDSFTNTIALLQEYGIYQVGALKASDIKEIRVTNYFVGYDLEENRDGDINYDNTKTSSVSYTDEENIEKIIEVSISNSYHNPWFNYDTINEQFGIEVYLKGNSSSYSDQYYSFIRGKVPDFVKADTKG